MKALKLIVLAAVLVSFTACDDGWIMDLEPPYGGYLWRVTNGSAGSIQRISPTTGERHESYRTPFPGGDDEFPFGHNYDAAAGDGRVWVGGAKYIEEYQVYSPYIWEVGGDDFGAWASSALTYDGEYLWAAGTGWDDGDYTMEFYRIHPDTHDWELMFSIDVPDDWDYYKVLRPMGLAWDGNHLWAVCSPGEVIIQIDRNEGEVLIRIPSPAEASRGLTWDGEALWVNDVKSDRIYRVAPEDGKVLGYLEMSPPGRLPPPAPYGLAFEFPSD